MIRFSQLFLSVLLLTAPLSAWVDRPSLEVEQVTVNEGKISVLVNNCWHAFDGFHATTEGLFVAIGTNWQPLETILESFDFRASWKCTRCGSTSMDAITICPYCGTPRKK